MSNFSDIPTPRTDAEPKSLGRKPGETDVYWVKADFARDLERKLAEVTAERDAEREARKALQAALGDADNALDPTYVVEHRENRAALALAAKLP